MPKRLEVRILEGVKGKGTGSGGGVLSPRSLITGGSPHPESAKPIRLREKVARFRGFTKKRATG